MSDRQLEPAGPGEFCCEARDVETGDALRAGTDWKIVVRKSEGVTLRRGVFVDLHLARRVGDGAEPEWVDHETREFGPMQRVYVRPNVQAPDGVIDVDAVD